jgi:hypothetical protein
MPVIVRQPEYLVSKLPRRSAAVRAIHFGHGEFGFDEFGFDECGNSPCVSLKLYARDRTDK